MYYPRDVYYNILYITANNDDYLNERIHDDDNVLKIKIRKQT